MSCLLAAGRPYPLARLKFTGQLDPDKLSSKRVQQHPSIHVAVTEPRRLHGDKDPERKREGLDYRPETAEELKIPRTRAYELSRRGSCPPYGSASGRACAWQRARAVPVGDEASGSRERAALDSDL